MRTELSGVGLLYLREDIEGSQNGIQFLTTASLLENSFLQAPKNEIVLASMKKSIWEKRTISSFSVQKFRKSARSARFHVFVVFPMWKKTAPFRGRRG